jgi:hypothetical protein
MNLAIAALVAKDTDLKVQLGTLLGILDNGLVAVRDSSGHVVEALVLQSTAQEVNDALRDSDAPSVLICASDHSPAIIVGIVDKLTRFSDKGLKKAEKIEHAKSLVIEAGERIELKCGGSAITLTKEGTVVVRGTDVSTRAKRNNKIRGATVQIN